MCNPVHWDMLVVHLSDRSPGFKLKSIGTSDVLHLPQPPKKTQTVYPLIPTQHLVVPPTSSLPQSTALKADQAWTECQILQTSRLAARLRN